jgi:hypothetical protein
MTGASNRAGQADDDDEADDDMDARALLISACHALH